MGEKCVSSLFSVYITLNRNPYTDRTERNLKKVKDHITVDIIKRTQHDGKTAMAADNEEIRIALLKKQI